MKTSGIRGLAITGLVGALASAPALGQAGSAAPQGGLTAVAGVKVGHHTLSERLTGCTVVLVEGGAVGGVDVRGGGPSTRETEVLDPVNSVEELHAIVLSGGSSFGLDAATGVMRYLEERGVGLETGVARVPIVVGASLFDLDVGGDPAVRPDADCGYLAASSAVDGPVAEGNVGAGAGATVGRLQGAERRMKGGIGTASITLPDGLTVAAIVAVNAIGDVVDPATGKVLAGVRTADGTGLADARKLIRSGATVQGLPLQNTSIGVVATNAGLTKSHAAKVAQMAHDGLARAIYPAHMPWDGDTIFCLGTGEYAGKADVSTIGALAAEVMAEAVVRAVRAATSVEGFPAAGDLPTGGR